MILKCVNAFKYLIMKGFFSQIIPQVFDRVKLRGIRWQLYQTHIFGLNKRVRTMPPSTVNYHDNPMSWMPCSHLVNKHLHAIGVDIRQNQRVKNAISNRNSSIGISVLLRYHGLTNRTKRFWTPTMPGLRDTTEASLVLKHQLDRPFVCPLSVDLGEESGQFFFHSSWIAISDLG